MSKKGSAPEVPDPIETAGAQTGQNVSTAIAQQHMNNVNQYTPDGSLTYKQTGSKRITGPDGQDYEIPTYSATQSLSSAQQAIKNQTDAANLNLATLSKNQSGRLEDLLARPMDTGGLPERSDYSSVSGPNLQSQIGDVGDLTRTYGTDFSEDRQRVEDALMERLNPSLERDREALEARLASQGLAIGSEGYRNAMDDFGRQSNDARLGAIINAGSEQSRLAGLEAQRAQFENSAQGQAFAQESQRTSFGNDVEQMLYGNEMQRMGAQDASRTQALQEELALRNQPINEITALLSGSQVQSPNFVNPNTAQLANTDVAGLINGAYQNELNAYNTQMGAWNSGLGALGGLGAAAIYASDRRLKKHIHKVGNSGGLNVYEYRYVWESDEAPMRRGFMAQEVLKSIPEAVVRFGKWLALDYSKLPEVA